MVYLKNLTIFRVRDCVWGFPEIFLVVSVQCLLPETGPEAQEFSPFLLAQAPSKPFTLSCHCRKVCAKWGVVRVLFLLRSAVEKVADIMLREIDGTEFH